VGGDRRGPVGDQDPAAGGVLAIREEVSPGGPAGRWPARYTLHKTHNMEREPIGCDARLVRAARSLYVNRRNRELVEARIERASEQLLV